MGDTTSQAGRWRPVMDSSQAVLGQVQVVEVQVELFWLLVTWWQQDGTSPAAQWHGRGREA